MTTKKQTGQDGCNRDLTLTPETERSAKEAAISLSDCLAAITAQQAADIAFDLARYGQQHPDFLHDQIEQHPYRRTFVAQLQKRLTGGAR
jgi:hypothetical protein